MRWVPGSAYAVPCPVGVEGRGRWANCWIESVAFASPSSQPIRHLGNMVIGRRSPPLSEAEGPSGLPIGFQSARSRRLIDVPACPIATEAINQRLPVLREQIRATRESIKRGGTLLLREAREGVVADPNAEVSERVGRYSFQFRAGEFFQNNPFILPAFVDHVVRASGAVQITELIDIYCGVGVFSISASSHFQRVTGIEVSASSVRWARANAKVNGIDNCRFLVGRRSLSFHRSAAIPPRRRSSSIRREKGVIRISSGSWRRSDRADWSTSPALPATQARDLKLLVRAGYEVIEVQPFDLFPRRSTSKASPP